MTDTGQIITMCRDSLKWPRSRLSEKSGVSITTIINIERNGDCRVSTFERLLESMGYELEVLRKE